MRSVDTPDTNSTCGRRPSFSSSAGIFEPSFGLADHHEVHVVALGAHLGDGLEQRDESLERLVRRRGDEQAALDARDVVERTEHVLVDADRHDLQALGIDAHLGDDVLARVLAHGHEARDLPRDLHLHVEERVPTLQVEALEGVLRVRELEVAVDRDGVVEGGADRPAVVHHPEHPAAERLVVVHEVEVGAVGLQPRAGPLRERPRLGEHAGAHEAELAEVDAVPELPRPRDPERVARGVEIHARDLHEALRVVELGVRRAREDLDVVPERDGLAGDVAGVDALAATVGVAPVDQPGDAERLGESGGGRHEAGEPTRGPLGTSGRGPGGAPLGSPRWMQGFRRSRWRAPGWSPSPGSRPSAPGWAGSRRPTA